MKMPVEPLSSQNSDYHRSGYLKAKVTVFDVVV